LARELERDVKRVHEDVGVLIECGLVARTVDGKINVPYDVIRAEFDLRAVADSLSSLARQCPSRFSPIR
jgi:predicted transcriptional regulator